MADFKNKLPVTMTWTFTSTSAPPVEVLERAFLFYGGVTRIRRECSHEDGEGAIVEALKDADRILANGVAGAGWSGWPIEVIATFDYDTRDIILLWRVPFCDADRVDELKRMADHIIGKVVADLEADRPARLS